MESRLAMHFAMTSDCQIVSLDFDDIGKNANLLNEEGVLPIGSVEYVREVFRATGTPEPENISYPQCLRSFLRRDVTLKRIDEATYGAFIKPEETKLFTGFVLSDNPDEHDREQLEIASRLPGDTLIWESKVVRWLSEFRFYVLDGQILGQGRYDSNEEGPEPDIDVVTQAVEAWARQGAPRAFGIDFGVLSTGETALVECNDAWALGYYKGTLLKEDYLRMLYSRWNEIRRFEDVCCKEHENFRFLKNGI